MHGNGGEPSRYRTPTNLSANEEFDLVFARKKNSINLVALNFDTSMINFHSTLDESVRVIIRTTEHETSFFK